MKRRSHIKTALIAIAGYELMTIFFSLNAATVPVTQAKPFSWVDCSRYKGDETAATVSRADLKQLMYEFQKAEIAKAATTGDPDLLNRAETEGAYTRISLPRNNNFSSIEFILLHWERNVAEPGTLNTLPEEETIKVFVTAPVKNVTYRGSDLSFVCRLEDFFEDVSLATPQITGIRIDGSDGSGMQEVTIGEPVSISYSSTGEKTVTVEATLEDGTVLKSSSIIDVATLATPVYDYAVTVGGTYNSSYYGAQMYVLLAPGHSSIETPVLVVEGFDMDNTMDWDVIYNIVNKQSLAEKLSGLGRDLLVVDFDDAILDIFGNTMAVIDAIQYINTERAGTDNKFTVIGASMGGLVSRLALTRMEQNPGLYGNHEVDTWISFDSPQKGANIPLGLQEMLFFFHDKNDSFAAAAELLNSLNSSAAKQMLLLHYTQSGDLAGNSDHDAFQTAIDAIGYPTQCKTIAISNGSGNGIRQPFSAGQKIINWHYSGFIPTGIGADIYAVNTYQSPVPIVFYGLWYIIFISNESTTQRHYYTYSIDNAPGGQRASFQQLFDSLPSEYLDGDDYCAASNHCFIPATSSLGLDLAYNEYSLNDHPEYLALTPFDEVHCALVNEDHIDINAHNEYWFLRGILEDFDSDEDGFDDYVEYCNGTDYMNPDSHLTVEFTSFEKVPDGNISLYWNVTPNTDYGIYSCEKLGQDWNRLNDIIVYPASSNIYYCTIAPTNSSGFFKIMADPVDPAN